MAGPLTRRLWPLCAAALLASLAACDNGSADRQQAREDVDAAVEKTEDAVAAGARKAAELAETARDNTRSYFESGKAKEDAAAVGNTLKDAGAALKGTTEDAAVTAAVAAAFAHDPELSATRIDIDTRSGAVRLSGPAPNAQAKTRAEEIAKGVKGVASVDNQLEVRAAQ